MISTMPFYPRDAVLTPSSDFDRVSVSVCLSVTSRCSVKTDGRNNLVFGLGGYFDLSYTAR